MKSGHSRETEVRVPTEPVLRVENLRVRLGEEGEATAVITGASLTIEPGEVVGLIGESGAGKTMLARTIAGLLRTEEGARVEGSVGFDGHEITGLRERELAGIRGAGIGMVFQDPGTSLNPVLRVGDQLVETLRADGTARTDAERHSLDLLASAGFDDPPALARSYPQELSGGTQQRVMICLALARNPKLLIADEPTSSLDVETQDGILGLIGRAATERGVAVLLISHDFAVISRLATRVVVMTEGAIVESAATETLLEDPVHPATRRLVEASSRILEGRPPPPRPGPVTPAEPIVTVEHLSVSYAGSRGRPSRNVLEDVSFEIGEGETLGLVGRTGSGKTTLARCLVRIIEPDSGHVLIGGRDVTHLRERELRPVRRTMSMVFQSPGASLNPRRTVRQIVAEPLRFAGEGNSSGEHAVERALDLVALESRHLDRRPSELSGGQRQRIALARALVTGPRILICDEPFSSLDRPNQLRMIDLLQRLRDDLGLACLFISHDPAVVRLVADRIVTIERGRLTGQDARESGKPARPSAL